MSSSKSSKKCFSTDDISMNSTIADLKQVAKRLDIRVTRKEGDKYKSLSKAQLYDEIQKAMRGGKEIDEKTIIPSHRKSKLIEEAKALGIKVVKGMSGSEIQEILDLHDEGKFFYDQSKPKKYYKDNYHILYSLAKTAHIEDSKPGVMVKVRPKGERYTISYKPTTVSKDGNSDEILILFDKRYNRSIEELPVKIVKLIARLRGIPLSGKNKATFATEITNATIDDSDLEEIIKDAHLDVTLSEYKKNIEKGYVYANEVIYAIAPPRGKKPLKKRITRTRKTELKAPKRSVSRSRSQSLSRKPTKEIEPEEVVKSETVDVIQTPTSTIKRIVTCDKKEKPKPHLECKEKEEVIKADEEKPRKRSFSRFPLKSPVSFSEPAVTSRSLSRSSH